MNTKFPYADPATIEKKRALEFMALSYEDKYNHLMQLIKVNYEIREGAKAAQNRTKKSM